MNVEKIYQSVRAVILVAVFGGVPLGLAQAATDKPSLQDVQKQLAEAAEAIKHYSAAQRDEALKKAKAVVDVLDAKIDELQTSLDKKWDKMDQAARRKAEAAMNGLKKQRRQMAESYDAMSQSTAGAWEHVKKGFSDSYANLHDAWQKAEQEFDDEK